MAEENKIEVQIVLDDGSIQKGFIKLEQQAEKSASNISSSFGPIASGAAVVAGALVTVGASLIKAAHAGSEAENSNIKFSLALANAGKFSKEAADNFEQYAKRLEGITGIDDDLIIKNSALLVSIGKLSGEGLEKATQASLDLAKGLDIDTSSAFELVSKAASGSAGALSRYGIKVDETLPKSQQFASALGQIQQKFGGLSAAAGGTFSGQLEKVSLAFNNIFEALGKFIVASPALKATFGFIADSFNKIASLISQKGNVSFIDNLILRFADFALFIAQNVVPVVEFLVRSFITGFRTIQFVIDGFIAGFVEGLRYLLTPISAFSSDVKNFLDNLAQSTADVASESFNTLADAADKTFNTDISTSIEVFVSNYKSKLDEAISKNQEFSSSLKNAADSSQQDFITVGGAFSSFAAGFNAQVTDIANKAREGFISIGKSALNGLANAGGQAFAAFGKALVTGENALQSFIDSLLASFGQMAIQLGTQFILTGIAYGFAGLPNGGPLIAAGAALAAFGGILSALGGKGGAGSPASGGGGVGAGSSAPIEANPIGGSAETLQEQKPQSKIEVNIAGDVLDSHDTGLRIVDLINNAFDQNGVVVTGRAV